MKCVAVRFALLAWSCLVVATARELRAEDVVHKRWTIVATKELQTGGLPDLLTAALSKQADLELVERDQLSLATKELELSTILGSQDAARRLKLGQIVGADALVILSVETREKKSFLRLVISDCVYGARLRTEYFAYDAENLVALTQACEEAIAETRRQFASGIKFLIGVTQFLSKNLSHDYDHLQAGYAELLANALNAHPGVAVLEIEEARAIAAELDLTAAELKGRVVPLFVEGDFEFTKKEGQTEPLVHMVVRLTDGGRVQRKGERKELTQSQCVDLLTIDLPPRLLQISTDDKTPVLSRERQREIFTKRANVFSELRAFEHSTALREAALLMHPHDHEQRINLVIDYFQWMGTVNRIDLMVQNQRLPPDAREKAEALRLKRRFVCGQGMSYHTLELVQRRGVNCREVSYMMNNIAMSIPKQLAEEFFFGVVRGMPRLDANLREGKLIQSLKNGMPVFPHDPISKSAGMKVWLEYQTMEWQEDLLQILVNNYTARWIPDGLFNGRWENSSVPLLERFLKETSASAIPLKTMAEIMFSSFSQAIAARGLKRPDVVRFYERLKESGHEVSVFYGRCGLLECAYAENGKLNEAQLRELDSLSNWLSDRYGNTFGYQPTLATYKTFFNKLRDSKQRPEQKPSSSVAKKHPLSTNLIPAVEQSPRVTMHRLESLTAPLDFIEIVPSESFDVLWSCAQIAVMRTPGKIEPILSAQGKTRFQWVTSDGHDIWVATTNAGVWVVSPEGKIRAKITANDGLPEYGTWGPVVATNGEMIRRQMTSSLQKLLLLHPISRGKVLAIGTYGPHSRKWFAQLSEKTGTDDGGPSSYEVRVFHIASKDGSSEDSAESLFHLFWLAEYRDPRDAQKRTLLVGRARRLGNFRADHPLEIDLDQLKVSVSTHLTLPTPMDHTPEPTLNDKVFTSGTANLFPIIPPDNATDDDTRNSILKKFIAVAPPSVPATLTKNLVGEIGVVQPGPIWNLTQSGVTAPRPLSTNKMPHQHRLQFYGRSTHYGLVGWNYHGPMYQVRISPASNANPSPWKDEYVPLERRTAHHQAAERIRELGGFVDGDYDFGSPLTTFERWTGGTVVYLPEKWRGTGNDLTLLLDLYNISHLYLVKAPVNDDDMPHIGKIKSLQFLYLEETGVTNRGLIHLRSHPNLCYLRLEGTVGGEQFGDEAMETAASLPKLRFLILYGSGFTNAGLAQWKKCPMLEKIFLLECSVTQQARETLMREMHAAHRLNAEIIVDSPGILRAYTPSFFDTAVERRELMVMPPSPRK